MKKVTLASTIRGAAIATAVASLLGPAVAFAGKADKADSKAVKCNGTNDCKGKGNCKGASNDCKGQNACKGQSYTMMKSKKDCTDAGGTVASAKEMNKETK